MSNPGLPKSLRPWGIETPRCSSLMAVSPYHTHGNSFRKEIKACRRSHRCNSNKIASLSPWLGGKTILSAASMQRSPPLLIFWPSTVKSSSARRTMVVLGVSPALTFPGKSRCSVRMADQLLSSEIARSDGFRPTARLARCTFEAS